MQPVIDELKDKNLLVTSEGAQIVDLEEHKLGVCMIQRSDGGSLYATRDLATAIDRYDTYNFDFYIMIIAVRKILLSIFLFVCICQFYFKLCIFNLYLLEYFF